MKIDFTTTTDIFVHPKTNFEERISIFESRLTQSLRSGKTVVFRGGDVGVIQFSISQNKHLIMTIPLLVSIPYAKPATWVRFFMKTQYHNIALSVEQADRLREIPELRGSQVKVNSDKKTSLKSFIEIDLETNVKKASKIMEEIFRKAFQLESDYKVIYTFADLRNIRWSG